MTDPPSNAELGRMIAALGEQVQQVIIEIRADRAIADNIYLRKEVWKPQYDALVRDIKTVRDEAEEKIKDVAKDLEAYTNAQGQKERSWRDLRNQVIGGLILIAVPSIITAIIAISSLLRARGG